MELNELQFSLICYVVLASDYYNKNIDYLHEKIFILTVGYEAYNWLSPNKQKEVRDYLLKWKLTIPVGII